ncbi:diguanylate cyclase domain-containing protein [Pseudodonghicola flavimaris]|uniref:diguanylate cyclase n=1 Tax=Pseudodonghicola flavimaris TaxID=3050036 RepID=A0ABT7F4L4_9RHOB|nr:diguanylate cyclase [Pseudodonghicola flavimaris]MDK3019536.1 diguanylate cyclase [Pseudodonghicola flavimaris]
MQGTILILDGVSTTRIMLKVQLSAAWYRVVQASRLAGILHLVRKVRPDLIITSMSLPDGDATRLRQLLQPDPLLAAIPIIAVVGQNDRPAKLRALQAGMDEALFQPLDDRLLQARIRSLIRSHFTSEDLTLATPAVTIRGYNPSGMADPAPAYIAQPQDHDQVVLLADQTATAAGWRRALERELPYRMRAMSFGDLDRFPVRPGPDAAVVDLSGPARDAGLRLLADLRARGATRDTAVIAVPPAGDLPLAAEALDRGAHDVLTDGFDAEELALRLDAQIRRKAMADRLRATLRDELQAALRDPMTGLFNRRYAMPRLAEIARAAADRGEGFAVMLADLDEFKRVNDRWGHPAGDAVLVETAHRLREALDDSALIARMGGEEFLIALPRCTAETAARTADFLRRSLSDTPMQVMGVEEPIHISASIGVAPGHPAQVSGPDPALALSRLIRRADRALYAAKRDGRNRVTLAQTAPA